MMNAKYRILDYLREKKDAPLVLEVEMRAGFSRAAAFPTPRQ